MPDPGLRPTASRGRRAAAYGVLAAGFTAGLLLASVHGAVLLAPLLGETLWPGIWGQGRATTLAAHQLLSYGWWDRRQALNVHGHDAAKLRLGRALLPVALVTCLWAAVASGTGLSPAW